MRLNRVFKVSLALSSIMIASVFGANVGYTTVYTSTNTSTSRRAHQFTMPEDAKITSISMYHNTASSSYKTQFGIYANGTNNLPGNKLAATAKTAMKTAAGWQTINLTTPIDVTAGTKFWIAWMYQSTNGLRRIGTVSGSPGYVTGSGTWSTSGDNMPSTFGTATTTSGYNFSVYATYSVRDNWGVGPATPADSVAIQPTPSLCDIRAEYCSVSLPGNVDLRERYPFFLHVKSQNSCGSCHTNAITGAMEYLTARSLFEQNALRYKNPLINLSVAQALGCLSLGCAGNQPYKVMKQLVQNSTNIVDSLVNNTKQEAGAAFSCNTTNNAYVELKNYCHCNTVIWTPTLPPIPIVTKTPDPDKIKKALANGFPVVVNMHYDQTYASLNEISSTSGEINHAVLIIGYIGNSYWIVQNSHGIGRHGGDGIFNLSMNSKLELAFAVTEVSISDPYKQFSVRHKSGADVNLLLLGD